MNVSANGPKYLRHDLGTFSMCRRSIDSKGAMVELRRASRFVTWTALS